METEDPLIKRIIEIYDITEETENVAYNWVEPFIVQRQYKLEEKDPMFMEHFNPHRTNDLNIEKQKQRIEEQKEKRKQRDVYRKEVKNLRKQNLMKQNEQIQKSINLQKLK